MPLTYIPKDKGKKKKPRFGAGTSYDYLSRLEKSAVNQLNDLAGEGLLDEFAAYREDGPGLAGAAWNALKQGGSSALDLVNRSGYAAGGAMEEAFQGNAGNIPARVGTELFSGIGGLKGQKERPSDVLRQETNYGQWSEEHPILSMGTDFAADVALDPSTYAGGLIAKGGAKLLSKGGKGIQWVASKTKTGEKIADTLGRTFDPAHLWKKAGAEKGYDIVWQEGKFADALRQKYGKEIEPIVKALRDRNFTPPQVAEFIRVGYGDIPIEQASQQTQALMPQVRDLFKTMGRRDYRYIGKDPTESMIENYLPNRPMAYNELMSTAGKRSMTGYSVPGGFKDYSKSFQKGKVFKEGEETIEFMKSKGVAKENMGEAMARSIETRAGESVAKIRVIRTQNRLINELPDDFRKLELGTRVPWDKQLQAGESLWMPAGNIRMYMTQLKDVIPDSIMERLLVMADEGGIVSEDFLKLIEKEVPSFTTRVPVYAVKTEIAEALTQLSHGMGKGTIVDWWDKVLGSFKNTAILWPGFHLRNLESSTAQNYIAGVKPEIYNDVKKVLTSKNGNEIVLGKSVDGWKNIMTRNGVMQGGFVGQMTGKATGTIGKVAEPVFEKNRAIGQHIENISRAALFMDRVEKGLDPLEAAKAVKNWHFDYRELTGFEQGIARRLVPFYAWTRKNVPLQLEMIFKAPNKYRNIAYLKHAVAGGKYDENAPEWWEQQDVWQTKATSGDIRSVLDKTGLTKLPLIGEAFKVPDTKDKVAVSMGLPYADLNMLSGNPAGMLGPASTLMNAVNNYDAFLERPIQSFKGEKKPLLTIGNFQLDQIPGLNNPKVLYALQGLIPISKRYGTDLSAEISRIFTGKEKPDDKYRAVAKLIGVRVLPNVKSEAEKRKILMLLEDLREFKKYREQEGAR